MWFLRACLFLLAILWGSLAFQGIGLLEALVARVGSVEPGEVIYVVGVPAVAAAGLAILFIGTWRSASRRFLGVAAVAAWLSFALFWPYGIVLTSGF